RPHHQERGHPRLPTSPPLSHKTLHLFQDSTAATTTGSTLWLGAQVLTIYLYSLYTPSTSSGKRVLDLGAGIGLTSLALAALGWDVTSTDVSELVSGILQQNIEDPRNTTAGTVTVQELDWIAPPLQQEVTYDLIITADTIYSLPLVVPLLNTIRTYAGAKTVVLVALEVRDEALIRGALEKAVEMGFVVRRVPKTRLRKALSAARVEWAKEEWSGVEVWKLGVGKDA
ncbi:putative methyltransferase-domain-containing protein, partial [Trichophaea hybrida]